MLYDDAITLHSDQAALFAARYEALAEDPYASVFAYSRMRLWEELEPKLRAAPGMRVLDVGCGTGHDSARLTRAGFTVTGVDGSSGMLEIARSLHPDTEFIEADVRRLPVETASVDVVLSIEVFRYLPEVRPALAEIARVLRPGGQVLATAAPLLSLNAYPLVNRIALRSESTTLTRVRQYFALSPVLRRAVRDAGFSPVEISGVYLGPLNWVERLAPRRLPGLLRRLHSVDAKLADRPLLRDLSNMYLVAATRDSS